MRGGGSSPHGHLILASNPPPPMSQQPHHHLLSLLQAAARHPSPPSTAQNLHAHLLKLGLHLFPPLPALLLRAYARSSLLPDALRLFDIIPRRDPITWSALLARLTHSALPHKALSLFASHFRLDGAAPDGHILASLANACASLSARNAGRQVHGRLLTSPYWDDDVVRSALVDMYSKCRSPEDARRVFDEIGVKNCVSWTAMVSGYARSGMCARALGLFGEMPERGLMSWTALVSGLVQSGNGALALDVFNEMRRDSIRIEDPLVIASALGAAANLAGLALGSQLHCLLIVLGYGSNIFVGNALLDMYAKSSDLCAAKQVFDGICNRDVVSWTAIIVGFAHHGLANEALDMFECMIRDGLKPNEVTFVGLIYACSHAGLVEKGRQLFDAMTKEYGINPSLQHYTCLLDLLCRSGLVKEADCVLKSMPFEPDEPTWSALLCACRREGDTQLGLRIAHHVLNMQDLKDPSTFVLLSNTYARAGMWGRVSEVRRRMASMAVRKVPGYSWVDFGKESYMFCAGGINHPMKDEICGLLVKLNKEMRKRGYIPDTSSVLHDLEDHEKEEQLFLHSERLAVALGLLKSVPGTTIRVVKNLRVCGDCHVVLKLVSSIVGREIVVRDANRFHHFRNGICSCRDFW